MPRVALAAWDRLDHPFEHENAMLAHALAREGVDAERVPWDAATDWGAFDLVMVRSTWDYTTRLDGFLAWAEAASAVTALWNPPPVLRWNARKTYLRELAAAGVPVPPTRFLGPADDLDVAWPTVVVKPAVDAGARRAWRGPAADARAIVRTFAQEALVQPYLPSVERDGETSLVFFDDAFSHAVRKVPASGDWRVQRQWGGTHRAVEPTTEERAVAEAALRVAPGPRLHARVDLVRGLDGAPCVMEVELVEPVLFLDEASAARAARAIAARCR